jgi:hypothetical protein
VVSIPDISHLRVKDRLPEALGCNSYLLFDEDTLTFSVLCLLLEECRIYFLQKHFSTDSENELPYRGNVTISVHF